MKKIFYVIFSFLLSSSTNSQTFQNFISRVTNAPQAQRDALVDSFMAANPVLPLRENDMAHFIYRGTATRVNVPGDANGWEANAFAMIKLSTTNLWYHSRPFESDARLDYKFVVNGSNWILDPRNPHQVSGGFGPNSELRMPEYVPPPEIQFYAGIPHGSLRDTSFFSVNLNNSRTIRVYTPPDYAVSSERYPVVLFHDGLEFISLAQANNVIDYLISQNRIAPIIAVFVPPVNRSEEYATNLLHPFTAFITTEVMPWLDRRYRTRTDPASRAVLGSSNGGNISFWLGYAHPEIFGNVAALSSNVESYIATGFQNSPKMNLKFYLDMGTYDIAILITRMNNFLPILQAKGYVYQYLEFHEGHSWGNWRAHIDNALEMFFPGSSSAVNEHAEILPQQFGLHQNYPNPFNRSAERSRRSSTTTIAYELAQASPVNLAIYNIQGQLVRTLMEGMQSAGRHAAVWDGKNSLGEMQASGVYFYRLLTNGRMVEMRRMILLR